MLAVLASASRAGGRAEALGSRPMQAGVPLAWMAAVSRWENVAWAVGIVGSKKGRGTAVGKQMLSERW